MAEPESANEHQLRFHYVLEITRAGKIMKNEEKAGTRDSPSRQIGDEDFLSGFAKCSADSAGGRGWGLGESALTLLLFSEP